MTYHFPDSPAGTTEAVAAANVDGGAGPPPSPDPAPSSAPSTPRFAWEDEFAKRVAGHLARILHAEFIDTPLSVECRISELSRELERLKAQLVDVSTSHAHALQETQ